VIFVKGQNLKAAKSKIELWETFSSALLVIVSFFIGLLVGLVAK